MKTVITYGVFDLFHEGHKRLLERARALGDKLIVGVTTDQYAIERGKLCVVDPLDTRMKNVRSCPCVDEVIVEDHPGQKLEDIRRLHADILAMGDDWFGKFDVLKPFCQVVYLPRTPNVSSSLLRNNRYPFLRLGLIGAGRIADRFMKEVGFVPGIVVPCVYHPAPDGSLSLQSFLSRHTSVRKVRTVEKLFDEKTKVLLLCNPQNPVGILWDKETLATLAEICERHGVIVLSDEIHGDLALYHKTHTPFCGVSDAAARIGMIFAGPTKAFNLAGLTGTAYCIIPDKEKREKYLGGLRNAKLDEASVMTIEAVIAAYREDTSWLESLIRYIEGNIFQVEKFVATHDLGIKSIRPQASFLIWLDFRELGLSQEELMDRFIKKAKVIPSNGLSYGPGGEGFVRLNLGCPISVLNDALDRIAKAFAR